jgi:NodT family efflux transporter outer membrane factor (OMF) lipoprotein
MHASFPFAPAPPAGLAVGAFALLLAGCASGPIGGPLPAEADLPAAWSATSPSESATSLAAWWQRFNDPLLTRFVSDALRANTSVLGAEAALRQARALRDVSAAGLQPTLGSSASVQRNRSGANSSSASTSNVFQAGLDAAWELDIFGGNRSALAASDATARASAASLGDVQVSVAAETALSYITLRGAQAQRATALANLASQRQTLQITEWRVQAGLLSTLEAEQARTAAAQTQAQLPTLQTTVQQAAYALAVLTGRPPAALVALVDPPADAPGYAPAPVPQAAGELALSLPADTLRQRADVRAAEQQVLAAQSRVAQADAARWPSFRLGGSLGLSALSFSALGNGAAVAGSLLAGVSFPLWDGGATRAQVRAQQAALDQTRSAYRGTVLLALQDVENALVALRNDRLRAASLQDAARAATQAATLARQRYSSGLVDFQTVLETQRSQLSAQDSLASISASVSADHVRLYKALGGGWQPDTQGPVEAPFPSTEARTR